MTSNLDPRLAAFRPDLADIRLKGKVDASHFADGIRSRVLVPVAPLRRVPRSDAPFDSELLYGEIVRVFDKTDEGWSWGQLETDSYVGYLPSGAVGSVPPEPTHRVTALRTFLYPGPELKLPPQAALSIGSLVALGDEVETRGTVYRQVVNGEGFIVAVHAAALDAAPAGDFVSVAERFLNTPYLWGGRSSLGVDCSSLLQLSLMMTNISAPRDTDMQEKAVGRIVDGGVETSLRRGDLVFWQGHVAILCDSETIIHASGHHMAVVREPLPVALARITPKSGPPTSVRRLDQ